MYICLFVGFLCPYIQKHPKYANILKSENWLAQDKKMTHSLSDLTFLVHDDEHVHACLVVEKFGIDYCQVLGMTI
jgi:hypothetical protein